MSIVSLSAIGVPPVFGRIGPRPFSNILGTGTRFRSDAVPREHPHPVRPDYEIIQTGTCRRAAATILMYYLAGYGFP